VVVAAVSNVLIPSGALKRYSQEGVWLSVAVYRQQAAAVLSGGGMDGRWI
jgi:hypothetical protein